MHHQLDPAPANPDDVRTDHSSVRRTPRTRKGRSVVDLVFWLPLFLVIVGMIWDLMVTFFDMNRAWDVAREVTQKVAAGQITHQEAASQAEGAFADRYAPSALVENTGERDVTFSLLLTPQLGLFGSFAVADMEPVNVSYTMRRHVR